jgi:hypothetical protein
MKCIIYDTYIYIYICGRTIEHLGVHVVGIVLFALLLAPATDPALYENRMWERVNQNNLEQFVNQ